MLSAERSRPGREPGAANKKQSTTSLGPAPTLTPEAPALTVDTSQNHATRIVTVRCPYCNKKHYHGWPWGQTGNPGSRVTPCHPHNGQTGTYRVTITPTTKDHTRQAGEHQ